MAIAKLTVIKFEKGEDFEKFFDDITAQLDNTGDQMGTVARVQWIVNAILDRDLGKHLVGKEFPTVNSVRTFCMQMLDTSKRLDQHQEKKVSQTRRSRSDYSSRDQTNRDKTVQFSEEPRVNRSTSRSPRRAEMEAYILDGHRLCLCCGSIKHQRMDCPNKTNAPAPVRPTAEMLEKARKEIDELKNSKN